MIWMEKQLESLTELVRELTRERAINEQYMLTKSSMSNTNYTGKVFIVEIYRFIHSIIDYSSTNL